MFRKRLASFYCSVMKPMHNNGRPPFPRNVATLQRNRHHVSKNRPAAVYRYYGQSTHQQESMKLSADDSLGGHDDCVIAKSVPHTTLVAALQECNSVEEQMMRLCSTLRLSPEDIKERLAICDMVADMMKPFFANFNVQLFGSTVNSFGFKGCDIDMTFETSVKYADKMAAATDDSYIPSIQDILVGNFSPEYMSQISSKDQLIFMHTVFLDYYKESTTAPLFISAYVPIIRFLHDRYNLKCDLSASNWSAIVNSKLLYAFNELDERVAPLVMAIRYWGKHCGLIGGGMMFNTYCITLLVIYFLQTRSPPVLPSVDYLLSQAESLKSDFVLDENVIPQVREIPRSKNVQTVEELFREFFFYYLYFDFSQVICTRNATSVSRDHFAHDSKRFKFNTICVQDPIKLKHNVSNLVDYRNCRKFAKEMLYASKLFQDKSVWTPKSSPWGLVALFDKPFNLNSMIEDKDSWTFNIPVESASHATSESHKTEKLLNAAESVVKVLEKGLLFKCKVIRLEDTVEDVLPSEKYGKFLLRASCLGEFNTWLGRNSVDLKDLPSDTDKDVLAIEHFVSSKLTKRTKEEKKTVFRFVCSFYAPKIENDPSLLVSLSSDSTQNLNPILGIFLKEYLLNTTMKLL